MGRQVTAFELAALIAAILGPMAAMTIGFALLFSNQINTYEQTLTEQYRETNRDTKTLIRDMAFLQVSLDIAPRGKRTTHTEPLGQLTSTMTLQNINCPVTIHRAVYFHRTPRVAV